MRFKRNHDNTSSRLALEADHTPEKIRERLEASMEHSYLSDSVLGGIDGAVTTFAIVAGTMGGGFTALVALALGLSNLVADGLSMAVSNFEASSSLRARILQKRKEETQAIKTYPEGEKEEIRQIYARKGFEGELLEEIVATITSDRDLWIDTMIKEEYGLPLEVPVPIQSARVTFLSFILFGLMPLLPFFYIYGNMQHSFIISCALTGIAFFLIGAMKGFVLNIHPLKEAVLVFLLGSITALLSYGISYGVTTYFSIPLSL